MNGLLTAAVLSALAPSPVDDKDQVVVLPLRGLTARCCEEPVRKALASLPSVEAVTVVLDGKSYRAEVRLKVGSVLKLTEIDKALEPANRDMGAKMGTKYEVDGGATVEILHYVLVKDSLDKTEATRKLSELSSFKGVQVHEQVVAPLFVGPKLPTLDQLRGALSVTDFAFAPQKDGVRYMCRIHLDHAAALPGKCTACQMELTRVETSRVAKETPRNTGG